MRSDKQSSLASKAGLGFRGPTTAVSSNTREILKGMQVRTMQMKAYIRCQSA